MASAAVADRSAFAAIYERHHQALYRYCRTITRNDEDARDADRMTTFGEQLSQAIRSRAVIEQAKGVLMAS